MFNINIKLEEPLKILKTISGSSLGLDLLNFAKEVPKISHETVPLKKQFEGTLQKYFCFFFLMNNFLLPI